MSLRTCNCSVRVLILVVFVLHDRNLTVGSSRPPPTDSEASSESNKKVYELHAGPEVEKLGLRFSTPSNDLASIMEVHASGWGESNGVKVDDEVLTINGVHMGRVSKVEFKQM